MVAKPGLRAVQAGEAPQQRKTVAQAAKSGTQRELLVAMRDRIAETVSQSNCAARDLAALTKRLQDIVRDIEQLDAVEAEQRKPYDGSDSFDSSVI